MHYVEYIPGTIARITEHPTKHGSPDVNHLSAHVVEFNAAINQSSRMPVADKLWFFDKKFRRFLLS